MSASIGYTRIAARPRARTSRMAGCARSIRTVALATTWKPSRISARSGRTEWTWGEETRRVAAVCRPNRCAGDLDYAVWMHVRPVNSSPCCGQAICWQSPCAMGSWIPRHLPGHGSTQRRGHGGEVFAFREAEGGVRRYGIWPTNDGSRSAVQDGIAPTKSLSSNRIEKVRVFWALTVCPTRRASKRLANSFVARARRRASHSFLYIGQHK